MLASLVVTLAYMLACLAYLVFTRAYMLACLTCLVFTRAYRLAYLACLCVRVLSMLACFTCLPAHMSYMLAVLKTCLRASVLGIFVCLIYFTFEICNSKNFYKEEFGFYWNPSRSRKGPLK